jgi:squalene-hopene/tetraprenyl-beta-curcumene cyclase
MTDSARFSRDIDSNATTSTEEQTPLSMRVDQESALATLSELDAALGASTRSMLDLQKNDGHWVFELEADCTIPSEYILLHRFLGRELNPAFTAKVRRYLLNRQLDDGGWPLYTEGHADISCTVKAYFALKIIGEPIDSEPMAKARQKVLELGGAEKVNVFTRIMLALFGQISWKLAPAMPIEITMLPDWFFFHLRKVSYWSRTVIVPLLILYARQPVCDMQEHENIRELFRKPPEDYKHLDCFCSKLGRKNAFILLDRVIKKAQSCIPTGIRESAVKRAERWTRERMNEGGIGAIFPAMANAVMALRVLGHPDTDPDIVGGLKALDELVVENENEAYCQPCHSPIWDTCLALSACIEAGVEPDQDRIAAASKWLFDQQIFDWGDWKWNAPDLEPGGWAFEYENTFYPDLDDTAMVLMSLLRAGALQTEDGRERIAAAINWVLGMQCSDGGWAAFDIDNNKLYLNDIPFADHGALLDPPTSDLTARCIQSLGMLGYDKNYPPIQRGIAFLESEQEENGSWFGRWGVNYLYGTWAVLVGLRQVGEDMQKPYVRKAVRWLEERQNCDGGWGESCYSYYEPETAGMGRSTPSQTAWALLGLMAAGELDNPATRRGIDYLLRNQGEDGLWPEELFTGTGFPRVFYLRYHGYGKYFPLWALGNYKRLTEGKPLIEDLVHPAEPFPLPEKYAA